MSLPNTKKGRVRMNFANSHTTLDNYYNGGSGVGAVSTSNRRALRKRAGWRPTSDGTGSTRCKGFCNNSSQLTFNGVVIDGYIGGATVIMTNDYTGDILASAITDQNGKYTFSLRDASLPTFMKVKTIGGTDLTTGELITTEFSSIMSKNDVMQNGNNPSQTDIISPVSTLLTKMIEYDQYNGKSINDAIVHNNKQIMLQSFGIEEERIKSDFIKNNDINLFKLVNTIEQTVKGLQHVSLGNSKSDISMISLAKTIKDRGIDNIVKRKPISHFNLADGAIIKQVIKNLTDVPGYTAEENVKTNAQSYIVNLNSKINQSSSNKVNDLEQNINYEINRHRSSISNFTQPISSFASIIANLNISTNTVSASDAILTIMH